MGRKTRRESLTRPSVLRTLGREPGSPRLTRYARYAFGAPPGGTEGEGEERRRETNVARMSRMTDDGGLLRSLKDSSLRYFLRSSVPSVSPRPSLSLHSPLRGREERTTEGVSDERSTRSGEGNGPTLVSGPPHFATLVSSVNLLHPLPPPVVRPSASLRDHG